MKFKLEELVLIKTQGVNTTTDNVKYSSEGVKVVQAKNIDQYSVTFDEKNFVSEETFKRMKDNHILKKGDVLYTNIGSQLGNCAIFNSNEPAIITWNVLKLVPNEKIILKEYLCYLLNQNKIRIKSE
jgi:type I restriction enzyme S subunit